MGRIKKISAETAAKEEKVENRLNRGKDRITTEEEEMYYNV